MADPARWPEWSPHIKHSIGFGPGQVEAGQWGLLFIGGLVPLAAHIDQVEANHSWRFWLGSASLNHRVEPYEEGSLIAFDIEGPLPVKAAMQLFYQPLIERAMVNLSREAAVHE